MLAALLSDESDRKHKSLRQDQGIEAPKCVVNFLVEFEKNRSASASSVAAAAAVAAATVTAAGSRNETIEKSEETNPEEKRKDDDEERGRLFFQKTL